MKLKQYKFKQREIIGVGMNIQEAWERALAAYILDNSGEHAPPAPSDGVLLAEYEVADWQMEA